MTSAVQAPIQCDYVFKAKRTETQNAGEDWNHPVIKELQGFLADYLKVNNRYRASQSQLRGLLPNRIKEKISFVQ